MSYGGKYSKFFSSSYRPNISPRTAVIERINFTPNIINRLTQSYFGYGHVWGAAGMAVGGSLPGLGILGFLGIPMRPSVGTGNVLVSVNQTRLREKQQLSQLNDKFAQYVEKIRFLEAQNNKLQVELEALQDRAGQGSSKIKEMYEIEINAAQRLIDNTSRDKVNAETKAREAEEETENLRRKYEEIKNSRGGDLKKIDEFERILCENEAKINLMKRRLLDLEDEAKRYKLKVQKTIAEMNRLQNEIQNEVFTKSCLEGDKIALEDELNVIKQMHEAELNELRNRTFIDGGLEPSQFFRNELANAIRKIREEHEAIMEQQRNQLHNRYMIQYNEVTMRQTPAVMTPVLYEQQRIQEEKLRSTLYNGRNEIAQMKARNEELGNRIKELQMMLNREREESDRSLADKDKMIEELRAKLAELMREYDGINGIKTSLEQEITHYRELLEGTTAHDGLRQIVQHIEEEARRLEAERIAGSRTADAGLSALSRISGSLGGAYHIDRTVTYSSGSFGGESGFTGFSGIPEMSSTHVRQADGSSSSGIGYSFGDTGVRRSGLYNSERTGSLRTASPRVISSQSYSSQRYRSGY